MHTSVKTWAACALAALMLAAPVCASAQSYRFGDRAEEISTIQEALTELKLYYAEITGHYGNKTEAAIRKFQRKYALTVDGIAGEETIKALYEAVGYDTSGITSSAAAVSGTVLRYQSQGDAVRQLQRDLTALGYYSGSVTGHFGAQTENAVKAFQRANDLTADGIAGSRTLAKIATALGSTSAGSTTSAAQPSSSASDTSVLRYMSQNEAVRKLQQDLTALGYYSGGITGRFGGNTENAVKAFQRANGLTADGIAGKNTLAKISERITGGTPTPAPNATPAPDATQAPTTAAGALNTSVTLRYNNRSDDVKKLQDALAQLGFFSGSSTGYFGSQTDSAVRAYQRTKGLSVDGIAGRRTLAAINADLQSGAVARPGTSTARAASVLNTDFYTWRRDYNNGELCTVYDFAGNYTWTLRIMSKDAHMDAEPYTAADTEIMNKAFGGKPTWTPKAVWVTFSDGKTYIGSTHNTPHGTQHLGNNNFKGHLCVHFPLSMSVAEGIGPNAVDFQKAITAGWEATQKLAK